MFNLRKKFKNEKGVALLVVLTLLTTVTLFGGGIIVISQTARLATRATTGISKFNLLAEGAANRVKWVILWDKAQNNPRSLGNEKTIEKSEELGFDRYIADGRVYTMDYYGYDIDVWIKDAAAGLNFYTDKPSKVMDYFRKKYNDEGEGEQNNNSEDSQELLEQLDDFKKILDDYVDENSLTGFQSMEKDEYSGQDMFPLPRDEVFVFRDELLWLSNSEKFFRVDQFGQLSLVRIMPPEGLSAITASDNLFAVPLEYIQVMCNLGEEESTMVAEGIKQWLSEGTPIEEALELELYTKVKGKFSFSESGFYTIKLRPGKKSQVLIPGRILSETVELGNSVQGEGFQFYEWAFY